MGLQWDPLKNVEGSCKLCMGRLILIYLAVKLCLQDQHASDLQKIPTADEAK